MPPLGVVGRSCDALRRVVGGPRRAVQEETVETVTASSGHSMGPQSKGRILMFCLFTNGTTLADAITR